MSFDEDGNNEIRTQTDFERTYGISCEEIKEQGIHRRHFHSFRYPAAHMLAALYIAMIFLTRFNSLSLPIRRAPLRMLEVTFSLSFEWALLSAIT